MTKERLEDSQIEWLMRQQYGLSQEAKVLDNNNYKSKEELDVKEKIKEVAQDTASKAQDMKETAQEKLHNVIETVRSGEAFNNVKEKLNNVNNKIYNDVSENYKQLNSEKILYKTDKHFNNLKYVDFANHKLADNDKIGQNQYLSTEKYDYSLVSNALAIASFGKLYACELSFDAVQRSYYLLDAYKTGKDSHGKDTNFWNEIGTIVADVALAYTVVKGGSVIQSQFSDPNLMAFESVSKLVSVFAVAYTAYNFYHNDEDVSNLGVNKAFNDGQHDILVG